MRIFKLAVIAAATGGLMTSAAAYAGQSTRSASALPVAKSSVEAPTSGVRSSQRLAKKSKLGAEGAVIGVAAAAAIGLGIYVAVDEEDGPEADSPG